MIDSDEEGKINFLETVLMRVVGQELPLEPREPGMQERQVTYQIPAAWVWCT